MLDLSGKIDPLTVSIYETIAKVADSSGIKYFIVGASARDMILSYGYGINTTRATVDIDIGIQVSSWEDYKKLSKDLVQTGRFTKSRESQRFLFNNSIPIDFIPFGNIETKGNQITWPPEDEAILNVLGFEEAYKSATMVRLSSDPVLDIRVASLAGLTILKLISFNDRSSGSDKDAKDLILIFDHYWEAGNEDHLYEKNPDILEEEDFTLPVASARLLGRDIAKIIDNNIKNKLLEILENETDDKGQFRFLSQVTAREIDSEKIFEQRLNQLNALKKGLKER
ncbi:MAG TPA: hypothetical protein VNN20_15175 [Thermodesulfobacteriota bacterium]|nr:hypothetical protein [Thermodesulfobacteriota bacterium]